MLSEFKCNNCQVVFHVGMAGIEPEKPVKYCICCGSSDLTFLGAIAENYYAKSTVGQEDIRDVFGIGQKVLVRSGIDWRTREILRITVLRHDVNCPHCGIPLLGEPRFWFRDWGNVSLESIMAREDIDPDKVR
jgi:hypothetical protein